MGDAKIINYSEAGNLYDIDQLLPGEEDYCIILREDRPIRRHWTALSKHNGLYEHFDTYGVMPDSELKWIGEKINTHLSQDDPYMTQVPKKEKENYIYNNVAYQEKGLKGEHLWLPCGAPRGAPPLQATERQYEPPTLLQIHEVH